MKSKKDKIISHRSRRNFLGSAGAFIAGLSFFRPLLSVAGINPVEFKRKYNSELLPRDYLQHDEILPDGVKTVWDFSKAYHETTVSRERICINGL